MKKNLKVLLPVHVFFPHHFYGTETYTLELAKCLRTMGHDPVILTATPFGEEGAGTLLSTYEYDGLPVYCIDMNAVPYKRFQDTYLRPELSPVLKQVVSEVKPDIAHVAHLIHHTATILEVLRDMQVPMIATLTDFYGICFTNILQGYNGTLCRGPNRRSTNCLCCYLRITDQFANNTLVSAIIRSNPLLRTVSSLLPELMKLPRLRNNILATYVNDITQRFGILKPFYRHYSYMIAPTEFLYDAYKTNGFYRERLRKINFGIDIESVSSYQKPKRKIDSTIRFGYIGQMAPHKGVDLLIEAFLNLKGDNTSLVIYGAQDQDPPYTQKLRARASGSPRIEFGGTFPRTELPRRLSEIDILVIPSRWYENSPLALLYALATRTPVIVSDVKGMTEFVKNNVNGFTFEMGNAGQLRVVMNQLLQDPTMIERLSEGAFYTKDVSDHTREVTELYEAALKNHSRRNI